MQITSSKVITYLPGQVRIGSVWNRYGEASTGNLGHDWSAALAHELGTISCSWTITTSAYPQKTLFRAHDDACPERHEQSL